MIIDASTERSAAGRSYDVCVVGTGPAGMTLALRLAEAGLDVALMEAGGFEVEAETQAPYAGENIGLDYYPLDEVRQRVLGGTSESWGGNCMALGESDFEPSAANPLSGWPIGKADLDPHAQAADAILDLASAAAPADTGAGGAEAAGFRTLEYRESTPVTRFGEKYRAEIEASEWITLMLNANLVALALDADLSTVIGATFKSYDPGDPGFQIEARAYALCLGGIENPRMLLNFARQLPAGIGNANGLVGRYFQEHPHVVAGDVVFERPRDSRALFGPTPEFRAEHGVLNFVLFLVPQDTPALSLPRELVRSAKCVAPFTERLAEAVLGDSLPCGGDGGVGAWNRRRGAGAGETGRVRLECEQSLVPDSRVLLGEELDRFGLRRPRLDWRLGEVDYATIRTAATAFGAHLAAAGEGRMQLQDWLLAVDPVLPDPGTGAGSIGGRHHMCTTRMSADPQEGVVDADCRVHGVENLYLGGSSVFATGGAATPTYTIVQLALRLGDHLRERLRA